MPDSETAVRTSGDEGSFLVVVKGKIKDSVLVTLKLILLLISLHVEHLDGRVLVSNDNIFVTFIKDGAVGAGETRVKLAGFFDHSDVPYFIDSVAVSGHNHVSAKIELHSIDRVVMAVECLHAKVGPDIPK